MATQSVDLFAETVDVPEVPGRPEKVANPFGPGIDKLIALRDAGTPKAIPFPLKHITVDGDESETMERVVNRAKRMVSAAAREKGVAATVSYNEGDAHVTFYLSNRKPRQAKTETADA